MDPPETAHKSDIPPLPEARQEEFFEAVLAGAHAAEERAGRLIRDIDLAGARVRLTFAGPALLTRMMPAMAHLELPPGHEEPAARLHVWDSESTGVPIAPRPCPRDWLTDRGDIWGMASRRFKSSFHWVESAINVFDLERAIGVYWTDSASELPYWAKASPFRPLFHWWLERTGGLLLHGAAVGTVHGALLITGKGGIGKSSTALACLGAGMHYVGDDYVAVRLDPEPRVFSLYSTAKLDPGQADRFPALRAQVVNRDLRADEKAVIQLHPDWTSQLARSLPLRAIATPTFGTGPDTTFHPIAAATVMRSASFTTMSQLPHAGQRMHESIERMVRSLPRAEMRLGNLESVAGSIREFLAAPGKTLPGLAGGARPDGKVPLVTVVIPVYNGSRFIPDAVGSILAQDYPALEIIVVDDGSTDGIEEVVRQLPVDVRLLRQGNQGPASAKNRGIRDASGEIIGFLDADDLWPAGNLEVMVGHLEGDPTLDVVIGRAQSTRYSPSESPGEYLGDPRESFPYCVAAALYRRRVFESVGLFDPALRFGEDSDWYLRAEEGGARILRIDQISLFARRHDRNMTRGKSLLELNALRVFKKALDRQRAQRPR